jgi:hypothetical protein
MSMGPGPSEAGPPHPVQTIICTGAMSVSLKNSLKRKRKPKLNFYRTAPVVRYRQHTQYQVNNDGSVSYTLKHLLPPNNAKATIPDHHIQQTHAERTLCDSDTFFSIPEPLDNLPLEVSLDILGQQRRKRTVGVRALQYSPSFDFPLTVFIQDQPLLMWLNHRVLFLREMIRLEGRVSMRSCLECDGPNPEYKCQDCFRSELHCSDCILSVHVHHPLH